MPRQHHNVFRGWQRQSPEYERKLTGKPLLTAEQWQVLLKAGWSLWRNGVWESPAGTYHTEAEARDWLSAPQPEEKPSVTTTEGDTNAKPNTNRYE